MVFQHTFMVKAQVEPGEVLAVTGSSLDLGQWKKQGVQPMVQAAEDK